MAGFKVVRLRADRLTEYESISIAFEISSRVDLEALAFSGQVIELPTPPRLKNYDDNVEERPTSLPLRVEMQNWGIYGAFAGHQIVGGIVLAPPGSGYEIIDNQRNAAVIVDLRISVGWRGKGVGHGLLKEANAWATGEGLDELLVETQDTNVNACRFYSKEGFKPIQIDPNGYGPDFDEAKIIWNRKP